MRSFYALGPTAARGFEVVVWSDRVLRSSQTKKYTQETPMSKVESEPLAII
jgi:hypothetical protein